MSKLHQFCTTKRQKKLITLHEEGKTNKEIAKELGTNVHAVSRDCRNIKARAAAGGYSPEHDLNKLIPEVFTLKGASTLYGKDGGIKLQWIKSCQDKERQAELMLEFIESMKEALPKYKPVKINNLNYNQDLMPTYILGDMHAGLQCWATEVGEEYDLKIFERETCQAIDAMIAQTPSCKQAMIIDVGDGLHFDNYEGVTTRSGHSLDCDSRYPKVFRTFTRVFRYMINALLAHHEKVTVALAIGNHNDTGAICAAECLKMAYENEPRCEILDNVSPFIHYQFGKTMLTIHHGHTCKPDRLPLVMAADMPVMWGTSEFRYGILGHVHSRHAKEHAGCIVESFNTMAARDSYAHAGGWRSHRNSTCVMYHRKYGEVGRVVVDVRLVRDQLK